ncbi:hypothetical protein ACN9ML_16305 [Dyadobacter endophyticus]|uniref:Uncharacterized protein n=1 Tax=Dyadobacter endophyticus TaxID=1749036 RepID=A0ABQ1Z331_9BACT|nr:hypothetical protein [Dyadobacter endophyticus]GGH45418.1 hypothetical protein GCM10007423_44350 [Dyadobacter endophyticus]
MHIETSLTDRALVPIKQRLLLRFSKAKGMVGPKWRESLAQHDPFFDTRMGEAYMRSVAQAYSDPRRGNVDRIERVTLGLERIAGIIPLPI